MNWAPTATELHFDHWSDIVNCGYKWYRQNKVGGTTNANINSALLYSFTDPTSPCRRHLRGRLEDAVELLRRRHVFGGDDYKYGFDAPEPRRRAGFHLLLFFSVRQDRRGRLLKAPMRPLKGTIEPENWALVDIDDGTYYIAEYLGILNREGRTDEETEAVKAFADWFGSAETQAAWSDEFDSFPCNEAAAKEIYGEDIPAIYTLKNFALAKVEGTDMTYAEYVAAHSAEWTNIMTNLGFYWADSSSGSRRTRLGQPGLGDSDPEGR